MKIKDLVTGAWYVSNGYIDSFESIELLEGYILYNLPFLSKFEKITYFRPEISMSVFWI